MSELKPFRFWCQKVLPLVYDDSLSYYELLCKVVEYLNNTITDVNKLSEEFQTLYKYVHDYFDNLDVQDEINKKLDEMAQNGELYAYIQKFLNIFTTPILYGCVGDGVTDDTENFKKMLDAGNKYIDLVGKTYLLSESIDIDARIIKNGTLKTNAFASTQNEGFINIKTGNTIVDSVNINCGAFMDRPFYGQPKYEEYLALRAKTLVALKIDGATDVTITNCKNSNCLNFVFISDSSNVKISNCEALQTMADGFYVTGTSHDITCNNCICTSCMDDCYSVNGFYADLANNPTRVVYSNCTAVGCFGAAIALLSCSDCEANNITSYGNKYSPIKLGGLEVNNKYASPSKNLLLNNITCELNFGVALVNNALNIIDGSDECVSENISLSNFIFTYPGNKVKCLCHWCTRLNLTNITFNGVEFAIENSTNVNLVGSNLYPIDCTLTNLTNFNITNNILSLGGITLGSCNNGNIKNNNITSIYVNNCKNINSDVKIEGIKSSDLTSEPYTKTTMYDMMKDGCIVHSDDGKIGFIFNKTVHWLSDPIS